MHGSYAVLYGYGCLRLRPITVRILSSCRLCPDNRIIPEKYYQLKFWSEEQELNGLFFMLAVETNDISDIDPSLTGKIIYHSNYLQFIHRGFAHKVVDTYTYIYEDYLPKTSYKLTYPCDFEYYGKNYQGPYNEDSEIEIYIPIE